MPSRKGATFFPFLKEKTRKILGIFCSRSNIKKWFLNIHKYVHIYVVPMKCWQSIVKKPRNAWRMGKQKKHAIKEEITQLKCLNSKWRFITSIFSILKQAIFCFYIFLNLLLSLRAQKAMYPCDARYFIFSKFIHV